MSEFDTLVCKVVHQIPLGSVATYGQVARLAGYPRHARHVGRVLAVSSDESLPWHRVVNAQGKISHRGAHGAIEYQQLLLEEEGIEFGLGNAVSLRHFQWQPDDLE